MVLGLVLHGERVAAAAQRDAGRAPPMRPSMTGALLMVSSRRMAILRPMLSPVIFSEIRGALPIELEGDLGAARLLIPGLVRRFDRYSPRERAAPPCAGSRSASYLSGVFLRPCPSGPGSPRSRSRGPGARAQVALQPLVELLQRSRATWARKRVLLVLLCPSSFSVHDSGITSMPESLVRGGPPGPLRYSTTLCACSPRLSSTILNSSCGPCGR